MAVECMAMHDKIHVVKSPDTFNLSRWRTDIFFWISIMISLNYNILLKYENIFCIDGLFYWLKDDISSFTGWSIEVSAIWRHIFTGWTVILCNLGECFARNLLSKHQIETFHLLSLSSWILELIHEKWQNRDLLYMTQGRIKCNASLLCSVELIFCWWEKLELIVASVDKTYG